MKLELFQKKTNLFDALDNLFKGLNIPVNIIDDKPIAPVEILTKTYKDNNEAFQIMDDVIAFGMVDDAAFSGNTAESLDSVKKAKKDYDGILLFGVTLKKRSNGLLPTRTQLAEITRAFNREYCYTPVVVVFRYEDYISIANVERITYKKEWREGEKAGKVSLLRDIDVKKPHTGHLRILKELAIVRSGRNAITNFHELYNYWQDVFSVSILNKQFYKELSDWYFWAMREVFFPDAPFQAGFGADGLLDPEVREHNAKNLIRLLTRILFVWFIKEKNLIPEELFDEDYIKTELLKNFEPQKNTSHDLKTQGSMYYRAILQNLFFATLNQKMGKREFRKSGQHMNVTNLMRYKSYFKNPAAFIELVENVVPFMNGGLFECLDRPINGKKGKRGGDVIKYIDGFSDRDDNQLMVPDYVFFGTEDHINLSDEYGQGKSKNKDVSVKGLIDILQSYKFTIAENTPVEQDIALDPELLGRVFENLLASYNPETKTTARKQTGSFYTPREIVNYMVDESLIAHLKNRLNVPGASSSGTQKEDAFFNPYDEINIHEGNLPHWEQKNVWFFVTFRLADSIPKEKLEQLKQDRKNWDKKNKNKKEYSKEEWKEYNRLFNERVEKWMNAGYGSCLLKEEKNAIIVADALKYFEGKRYELDEWIIMPNHVHVLVKPLKDYKLSEITHSWKSYTANEINKANNREGQLWLHESYDHIVRNDRALEALRNYIRQNPIKAGISIVPEASNVPGASSSGTPGHQKQDAFGTLDDKLHQLLSYDDIQPFEDEKTKEAILKAIDECKILDPACGSGAFPMGALQKMVHIIHKLDPQNERWKERQIEKAHAIDDSNIRDSLIDDIEEAFENNELDFGRKLYLIENCIYGVDIQPIAVQISKLRFFISLIVEQKVNKRKKNHGVRPLPNLETKFVAANTLIGLDKPEAQGNLFDSQDVKKLEDKLKDVRHRLFSAKTPETKRKLRKEDKELREQIAQKLEESGWENETARQLADWDPYDQNASSPFFDPEWMFDIADGFDVVIGNPPYKLLTKNSTNSAELKYYINQYHSIKKSSSKNLYTLFIENSINFLKEKSLLSFIVPEGLYRTRSYIGCVEVMEKYGSSTQVVTFSDYVFENAVTGNLIFVYEKAKGKELQKYHFDNDFNIKAAIDIERKEIALIENDCVKLKEVATMFKGMVVKNRDNFISSSPKNYKNKFLLGKNISKWCVDSCLYTNYNQLIIVGGTKKLEKHNVCPRILVRRTGDTICAAFLKEPALTESTLYSLWSNNKNYSNILLLGLLNSKLLNHYNKLQNITNQQGFPQILMTDLQALPLKKHVNKYKFSIEFLVTFRLFSNNKFFENIIDSVVFNLYFPDHMKERGIDVLQFVEQDINEVMQNVPGASSSGTPGTQKQDAFDTLTDEQKESVIDQLHKRWTDPENEVVKRMAMFKEKSPDILKPILES